MLESCAMFYQDLDPYHYELPRSVPDVVTVGWLARDHDYTLGIWSEKFLKALDILFSTNRVNQTRGVHVCELCGIRQTHFDKLSQQEFILGSAEIWLPSPDRKIIYAAPDLIYHYVRDHNYQPPSEYICAAVRADSDDEWDANLESEQRLAAAYNPK
jgi:hypothetical protein